MLDRVYIFPDALLGNSKVNSQALAMLQAHFQQMKFPHVSPMCIFKHEKLSAGVLPA